MVGCMSDDNGYLQLWEIIATLVRESDPRLSTAFTGVLSFLDITEAYRLSDSQIDELNKGDSFSNSSLRRKLFGNDSGSSDSLDTSQNIADRNQPVPSVDCWDSPPLVS